MAEWTAYYVEDDEKYPMAIKGMTIINNKITASG